MGESYDCYYKKSKYLYKTNGNILYTKVVDKHNCFFTSGVTPPK